MPTRHLILFGVILEALYLSLFLCADLLPSIATFIAVNAGAYALLAYIVHVNRGEKQEACQKAHRHRRLWLIIGFALLFRLTLLPHVPVASDDIYRYLWDGKVAAAGINPYQYAPTDATLAALENGDLSAKINHPQLRTIYPPLAQGLFLLSHLLFGDSTVGLKALLVVCDLSTIALLWLLLARFKRNPEALLLYAWSPLPIMYFALDGHIDALGIPFMLLFLLFLHNAKDNQAGVALGFGGLAKLYPLFLLPVLFERGLRLKRAWLPGIPIVLLAAGYLCYWQHSSGGLFESVVLFNSSFSFNGLFYSVMRPLLKSSAAAHMASTVLFACCLVWIFLLKRSILEKVFLTFFCFALFSPVVHPWYLTWLAALLVLRWSVSVFTLLGFSNLSNLVVYWYRATGNWENRSWLMALEYLPFLCLLFWELTRERFSPVPPGDVKER
ncbi:MAG TPA: hypothetical protein DEQ20_09420 [Desulfobulbaceae bacterium]|nr:MAG: hypothetical protein A2520_05155 [Deltaproteobacteria bacterium RIFOXYD12_FULL_53_23]HCC55120.1 hypothetical protein [Desulfobulbaceae bacterium]